MSVDVERGNLVGLEGGNDCFVGELEINWLWKDNPHHSKIRLITVDLACSCTQLVYQTDECVAVGAPVDGINSLSFDYFLEGFYVGCFIYGASHGDVKNVTSRFVSCCCLFDAIPGGIAVGFTKFCQ